MEARRTETSLYSSEAKAVAYIVGDGTIYLWNGTPVAYIGKQYDGGTSIIYGFNWKLVDFISQGYVFDKSGRAAGRTRFPRFGSRRGRLAESEKERVATSRLMDLLAFADNTGGGIFVFTLGTIPAIEPAAPAAEALYGGGETPIGWARYEASL
jgi:hypothetical protein